MEAITENTTAHKALSEYTPEELRAHLKKLDDQKQADRDAYKELVKETVPAAVQTLLEASEALKKAKGSVFDNFRDIMQLKAAAFGVKEAQQSHTFTNDGYSVTIGYRQTDGWDDTVSAGMQKVTNFIQSLATDENSAKLVATVYRLLNKDSKGNLKASRIVELQKLTAEFKNDEFTDGVNVIVASYKPVRSCWFIEATANGANGSKVPIPLSMSAVDFPEDFEFDFFNDTLKPKG